MSSYAAAKKKAIGWDKSLYRHIVRYRDLAPAGQTHCIHYCTGCCGRPNLTPWCECCVCEPLLVWAVRVVPAGEADVLFRCVWLCGCKTVWGYTEGQRPSNVIPPCAVSADFMCRPSSQISIGMGSVTFPRFTWKGRAMALSVPPRVSLAGVTQKIFKEFLLKCSVCYFS